MPAPARLEPLIRQAAWHCRATPGRQGRFVALHEVDDVLIAGDLHGNVSNFKRLLEIAQLQAHPRRHLVVQELIHGPFTYPRGGDQSHQLVDLFAALKCQFPHRVHYLLGNHELSQWTQRAILKNDQDLNDHYRQGLQSAYGDQATAIYGCHEALFAALPVVLRLPNGVILSHSLPGASRLPHWEMSQLFADPQPEESYKLGGTVHAVVWGRDCSEETVMGYLSKTKGTCLCSGHVPCDDGYQIPNTHQLILDCKDDRACCCLVSATEVAGLNELRQGLTRLHGATT